MVYKIVLSSQQACLLMILTIAMSAVSIAQEDPLQDNQSGNPSVGVPGLVEQIVLPGS